jgi:hypothetical protein
MSMTRFERLLLHHGPGWAKDLVIRYRIRQWNAELEQIIEAMQDFICSTMHATNSMNRLLRALEANEAKENA